MLFASDVKCMHICVLQYCTPATPVRHKLNVREQDKVPGFFCLKMIKKSPIKRRTFSIILKLTLGNKYHNSNKPEN